MNDIFAPVPTQPAWRETPAIQARTLPPHGGFATVFDIIATWEERARLRWQLAQMVSAGPHLVRDIGLTRRQVEAEIAKPLWRA